MAKKQFCSKCLIGFDDNGDGDCLVCTSPLYRSETPLRNLLISLRSEFLKESSESLANGHAQWATGLQRACTLIEQRLGMA
jgi:hypothetical protein